MDNSYQSEPAPHPLEADLMPAHRRPSHELIYETMSRAGGDGFGLPFGLGLASLTVGIVKKLSQHGFFAFESWERRRPDTRPNKFTRQGAAPYRGPYRRKSVP